mmetsp:Transcript_24369/g.61659  ORF Transcript_24369/g.61659 Transcript_24369/m.61659 type:complete len:82 (-) Transcript_24369:2255-2500(-)
MGAGASSPNQRVAVCSRCRLQITTQIGREAARRCPRCGHAFGGESPERVPEALIVARRRAEELSNFMNSLIQFMQITHLAK